MLIRRMATAVVVLLGLGLALARWSAPGADPVEPAASSPATSHGFERDTRVPESAPVALDPVALERLGDPALVAQIHAVVASFDRTGRPPAGVAQGGRRRGARGVFENAEGRLPRRGPGYYTESDVWPRGAGGRGSLRLVFGREREVYFTSDHYRSFTRLR